MNFDLSTKLAFCNSAHEALWEWSFVFRFPDGDNFFSRRSGQASAMVSKGGVSSTLARASKIHALATNLFRPGATRFLLLLRRRSLATSLLIQPRAFSSRLKNIYVLFRPKKYQPDGSMAGWSKYERKSDTLDKNIFYKELFLLERKVKYAILMF